MFSQTDIDRLIDAMRANGVTSLNVEADDDVLVLELPVVRGAAPVVSAPAARYLPAKSPCIGRFLSRGTDDGLAELTRGERLKAGDTLGYIQQSLTRAVVSAPADGVLAGDIPETGTVFGFGDSVFTIEVSA